ILNCRSWLSGCERLRYLVSLLNSVYFNRTSACLLLVDWFSICRRVTSIRSLFIHGFCPHWSAIEVSYVFHRNGQNPLPFCCGCCGRPWLKLLSQHVAAPQL